MIERSVKHWRELPNLSIDEAATILGISPRMVRNLLEAGDLEGHSIGRRQFVTVPSIRSVAGDAVNDEPEIAQEVPKPVLSAPGQSALQRLRETG